MPRTRHYRSRHLTRSQVSKAFCAFDAAAQRGMPLNLAIHVHWQWTRFKLLNRRDALSSLLESQRHWLAHRGIAFVSIAVRENGLGSPVGEHAHQILHVPSNYTGAFVSHTKRYLNGKRHRRRALCHNAIYSAGAVAYLCKGASKSGRALVSEWLPCDRDRVAFTLNTSEKSNQGIINGKRLSHFLTRAVEQDVRAAGCLEFPVASQHYR